MYVGEETDFELASSLAMELAQELGLDIALTFNGLRFDVSPQSNFEELRGSFFKALQLVTLNPSTDNPSCQVHFDPQEGTTSDFMCNALAVSRLLEFPVSFSVMALDGSAEISNVVVSPQHSARDIALMIQLAQRRN